MDELNEIVNDFLALLDDYCEKLTEFTVTIKIRINKEDEK